MNHLTQHKIRTPGLLQHFDYFSHAFIGAKHGVEARQALNDLPAERERHPGTLTFETFCVSSMRIMGSFAITLPGLSPGLCGYLMTARRLFSFTFPATESVDLKSRWAGSTRLGDGRKVDPRKEHEHDSTRCHHSLHHPHCSARARHGLRAGVGRSCHGDFGSDHSYFVSVWRESEACSADL